MRGQDLVTGWASEDSEFQDSQVRHRSIWSCPYCTVETRGQAVAGLIPTGSGASAHGQDRGNCGSGSQAGGRACEHHCALGRGGRPPTWAAWQGGGHTQPTDPPLNAPSRPASV